MYLLFFFCMCMSNRSLFVFYMPFICAICKKWGNSVIAKLHSVWLIKSNKCRGLKPLLNLSNKMMNDRGAIKVPAYCKLMHDL